MDDFGNSIAFYWDKNPNRCCLSWLLFHFYGMIGPGGCIHVACNEFIDLRTPGNHQ
jgi:hypothetical protein